MKNLLWGCLMFALTLALFQSNAIWWALALVFVAGVLALAAFGAFCAVALAIHKAQQRAARAIPQRPEWLPAVEPLPELEPEMARIERLRRKAELSEWPTEIDHGFESTTTKK